MNSKPLLVVWFSAVLVAMSAVTIWASLDRNVMVALGDLWREPWGRATLFDAYFAFVAVWLWIAWRERSAPARIGWLIAIFLAGNFAIAGYFLLALRRAPAASPLEGLFGRRPGAMS